MVFLSQLDLYCRDFVKRQDDETVERGGESCLCSDQLFRGANQLLDRAQQGAAHARI